MGERETKRVLLHAVGFGVIGLFCLVAAEHDFFDPGPRCPYCGGTGGIFQLVPGPPGVPLVEARTDCSPCDGSGLKDPYPNRLSRVLPRLRGVLGQFLWLAAVGALAWGLKAVDCRLCGGSGRLVLEALPPGEPASRHDADCVACGGRGRLGVLDRWVFLRGWEAGPSAPPRRPAAFARRRRGPAC
jgi:hypothetical protein